MSQAHARDARVRRPVGRARRLARDRGRGRPGARSRSATRSCRSAITRDGRWLLADAARELIAARPGGAAGRARRRGLAARGARGRGRPAGQRWAGRRRRVPAAARSRTARTARSRACSSSPTCRTSAPGVLGSAVGMDKVMMKRAFAACGLPQAEYLALRDGARPRRVRGSGRVAELGLPCFVKPANMGSSVGVSKAHDRAELDAAIELALEFDEWILAEEAVDGREIEVAVLGDGPPEASLPGRDRPRRRVLHVRRQVRGRQGAAAGARAARRRADRGGARARGARVRRVPVRGDGARRLLLRGAGPRLPRQRAQHDPRVHADLDVPDAVGGVRAAVPGAARPPHRAGRSSATPAAPSAPAANAPSQPVLASSGRPEAT